MRRPTLFVAAGLVAAAGFSLAAAPATRPASTSAPATTSAATTSASTASDPKDAVLMFLRAMVEGDEKMVFASLFLADDDAKKEAQAVLGEALAEQKWSDACTAAFSKPGDPDPGAAAKKMILDDVTKSLVSATVTVAGDAAQVGLNPGTAISVARDQGVWKIDFFKTQRVLEGPYNKEVVAATAAKLQIRTDMIAEVKAGKYATVEAASSELTQRLAKVPAPKMPDANPRAVQANRLATIAEISNLKLAIEVFELDTGRYPSTDEGLGALIKRPAGMGNEWSGPYLEKMPQDRWGHDYIYRVPSANDPASFDLSSAGPDGKPGTADDITKTTKE